MLMAMVGIYGSWSIGDKNTIYTFKNSKSEILKYGTPICFEDSFGNLK